MSVHVDSQDLVEHVRAAINDQQWEQARLLLHPYMRYTRADGTTIHGRRNVMAMLEQAQEALPAPASVQIRDGQIYRWIS